MAAEDCSAMSSDPESAVPEPEVSSVPTQSDEYRAPREKLEASPLEEREWRDREEDLAPAIYDSEVRPEPGPDWDERVDPVCAMTEPAPGEEMSPELRLVPDRPRGFDAAFWLAALRGLWVENYKSLGQSATLIALGAAMALLAVGFSRRHSPLPAGVQTLRPQTVRPESSPSKARRKRPHSPTSLRDAAKRLASPKKQSNLIAPKPPRWSQDHARNKAGLRAGGCRAPTSPELQPRERFRGQRYSDPPRRPGCAGPEIIRAPTRHGGYLRLTSFSTSSE